MPGTAVDAARALADALTGAALVMDLHARASAERALRRLQDVVLPRLEDANAPILIVVGGSTGSGKSTLVNSLVGRNVSRAGVVRPTTRCPVLVCSPHARADLSTQQIITGGCGDISHARGHGSLDALQRARVGCELLAGVRQRATSLLKAGGHGPGERTTHDAGTLVRVRANRLEEGTHRSHGFDGQTPIRQLLLVNRHDGNIGQSPTLGERRQIGTDLAAHTARHAVEDDRNAQAAAGSLLQVSPGDRIGIAGGAGDEDPQVRAVEELGREATIGLLHRVDVGSVEDGDARTPEVIHRDRDGYEHYRLANKGVPIRQSWSPHY